MESSTTVAAPAVLLITIIGPPEKGRGLQYRVPAMEGEIFSDEGLPMLVAGSLADYGARFEPRFDTSGEVAKNVIRPVDPKSALVVVTRHEEICGSERIIADVWLAESALSDPQIPDVEWRSSGTMKHADFHSPAPIMCYGISVLNRTSSFRPIGRTEGWTELLDHHQLLIAT